MKNTYAIEVLERELDGMRRGRTDSQTEFSENVETQKELNAKLHEYDLRIIHLEEKIEVLKRYETAFASNPEDDLK